MKKTEKTIQMTSKRTSNAKMTPTATKQQLQRIREEFPFYEFRRN